MVGSTTGNLPRLSTPAHSKFCVTAAFHPFFRKPKVASARHFATRFGLFATLLPKQRPETLDTWCTVKPEDGLAAVFETVMYLSWPGIFAAR